ncbi:MAG: tetratricopeptide repeat protein [Nitrospiraceae bacterium]
MAAGLLAVGTALLPTVVQAGDSVTALTKQARMECRHGRAAMERGARIAHFQQGQALAERAVALDEQYADAHFALFCNLGEQLRLDGESMTSVFGFRRMMNELDRTLELNPAHLDALSAKGTLLVKLPNILGGDPEKGEQLLQQVIKKEPRAVNARLALAKIRCERGRHREAVTLASEALTIARKHKRTEFIPEAKAVLQQVRANAAQAN